MCASARLPVSSLVAARCAKKEVGQTHRKKNHRQRHHFERLTMAASSDVHSPSLVFSWHVWIIVIVIVLLVRVWYVFQTIQRHRASLHDRPFHQQASRTIKTLVVLGSGGHTTEMLALLQNVDSSIYKPMIYMVASTDDTSLQRVNADPNARRPDVIYKLPRSRHVGQSYFTSIFTTLWSFIVSLYYVAIIRPDLLLCNGPGTCLPVAIATLLYRILGVCRGNVVFVESFCRVTRYEASSCV